jgi:exonuclease III
MPSIRIATFNLEELDEQPTAATGPAVVAGAPAGVAGAPAGVAGAPAAVAGAPAAVAVAAASTVKPSRKPTLQERKRIMVPQLERIGADILCLQEVHAQRSKGQPFELRALDDLIKGTYLENFHRAHTKDAQGEPNAFRNLVVLSRYRILEQELIDERQRRPLYKPVTATKDDGTPLDGEAEPIFWERPILRVKVDLGKNGELHLFNVHMKSKIPKSIKGQIVNPNARYQVFKTASAWAEGLFISSMERLGQAVEARIAIDKIFNAADGQKDKDPLIAICGDFNAENDEIPLKALCAPTEEIANKALLNRIMIPCERNVPESSRYSLFHMGHGEMIDHILVSRGMFGLFRGTEIHNEALPDESGPFRSDDQFPESDHAPVVAKFEVPFELPK